MLSTDVLADVAWGLVETRRTFLSYNDEFNGEDGSELYSHGPRESMGKSESQVCTSSVPRTASLLYLVGNDLLAGPARRERADRNAS